MARLLHIHIIASSRRVVTGLEVLLKASGLVDRVSVQDPKDSHRKRDPRHLDLVIVDSTRLGRATLPPTALLHTNADAVPWCALVYNQEQQRQVAESGATYVLPPGFAAESLFGILSRCLSQTQQLVPAR
jgi:hypothetical protein